MARTPIQDHEYEEHFAYAISHSPLRRYTGNCFKSEKDAILFILPVFLLLLVQIGRVTYWPMIPAWPFWILAFVWPVFLTVCNIFARRRYFRAENALRSLGVEMPQGSPWVPLHRRRDQYICLACGYTGTTEKILSGKTGVRSALESHYKTFYQKRGEVKWRS